MQGNIIKAARALLGWSQMQLAQAADVSEPFIRRLEADEANRDGKAGSKVVAVLVQEGIWLFEDGARLRTKPVFVPAEPKPKASARIRSAKRAKKRALS